MANIINTPTTWGLSVDDYGKGNWGTAVGQFKVSNTVIRRFRKDRWINSNGDIVYVEPDDLTDWTYQEVFDSEKAFNEMACTYINAIVASYEILRNTSFNMFEEDTRDSLKKAVYNAIEYSALNRQYWERVNGSSITTPNFTVAADQVGWLLSRDMIGMKGNNYLTTSGLSDYEWLTEDQLYKETGSGNLKVINAMDEVYNIALEDPSDGNIWIGTEKEIDKLKEDYNL